MKLKRTTHSFLENDRDSDYWLGIICSDGYIDKAISVGLELKYEDYETVKGFCDFNNVNSPKLRTRKGGYKQWLGRVYSKYLVDFLLTKGITNNKSLTIEYKGNITWDFIRGVFDGDGCISIRKTGLPIVLFYSSSIKFITQINNFLISEGFLTTVKLGDNRSKNPFYNITISKIENIYKFFQLLYKNNPNYFMKRKYEKFKKYFDDRETKDIDWRYSQYSKDNRVNRKL